MKFSDTGVGIRQEDMEKYLNPFSPRNQKKKEPGWDCPFPIQL